ncbi:MAG: DUF6178 family protein [Polyangia bacterium]
MKDDRPPLPTLPHLPPPDLSADASLDQQDAGPDHQQTGTAADLDRKGNVIALSRYRARLGRGRRMRRIDALMAQPHPEQAIRALPGDELYYLLREDDPREARDLLAYARPEQIRVVLDFGLWSGDQLVPERLEEWVDVMAEMPFETVNSWVQGLDTELIGLLIRKGARIYDVSIEEPPDEPEGTFYATPDRLFVLDVLGYRPRPESEDGESAAAEEQTPSASALIRIIDALYRADMNFCRRILVAAKSELDSELEEMALRWRQGRMADLGFIDPIEALEIYRELDPASVRVGELRPGTRMRPQAYAEADARDEAPPDLLRAPAILGEQMGGNSLFARALGRVTAAAEVEELHFALVALANRLLAADRVDAADDDAVAAGMARLRGTLDVAVEFLARAGGKVVDEDRAVDAVRTVPLLRLFRLGVSLVGKVRALGQALLRRGPYAALKHLDLVEEPEATVLAAVNRPRPLYAAVLDDPPAATERPFESLADIARATAAIQRAAVAQAMLLGLGVRPEHLLVDALQGATPSDPLEIDTALLARTALVLALYRDQESPPPLALAAVPESPEETPKKQPPRSRPEDPASWGFRPLTADEIAAFGRPSARRARARSGTATAGIRSAKKRDPRADTAGLAGDPLSLSDESLTKARQILTQVSPPRMEAVAQQMAERWLQTLSPLEPVLRR